MPTPDAKPEAENSVGSSETLAQAERQPFDAAEREAAPLEKSAPFQNRSRIAARKGLTSPNPLHKPPGKS
jgi:hypothetical protein